MLCGHALGVVFSLATRFEATTTANKQSTTLATSSKATGIHRLTTVISGGKAALVALLPLNKTRRNQRGEQPNRHDIVEEGGGGNREEHRVIAIRIKTVHGDGAMHNKKAGKTGNANNMNRVLPAQGE